MLAFDYGSWCDLRDIVLAAPSRLSDNTFRYLQTLEVLFIGTIVIDSYQEN